MVLKPSQVYPSQEYMETQLARLEANIDKLLAAAGRQVGPGAAIWIRAEEFGPAWVLPLLLARYRAAGWAITGTGGDPREAGGGGDSYQFSPA